MIDIQSFKEKLKTEGVKFKGFGLVYKFVMEDTDLSLEAKAIYAYHCSFAGNKSFSFPKRDTILHDLQLSKEGYYSHYNQLIANGYIKVEKKGKGLFSQNIYIIIQRPEKLIKAANEAPRGRDREVSTAGYGNHAARLRGIEPVPNKNGVKYGCLKDYGYGIVPKAVMLDPRLDIKAKCLYSYLVCYAGKDNSAQLRHSIILYHLDICGTTFYKYYNQLIEFNYITSEQLRASDNKFGINLYRLTQTSTKSYPHIQTSYPHNPQVINNIPSVKKQDATKPFRKKQDTTNITRSNKTRFNSTRLSSAEKANLLKKIEDEIINIRENLNYTSYINSLNESDKKNIDKSIHVMAEVLARKTDDFVIGTSLLTKQAFKDSITNLKFPDLTLIWDRIKNLENPIVNIKNYLITTLYNQGITVKTEAEKAEVFDIDDFFERAVRIGMANNL